MPGIPEHRDASASFGQKKGACPTAALGLREAGASSAETEREARSVDAGDGVAVLRPGLLVVARHRRPLLAIADGLDAGGIDAERDQSLLRRIGAALAEAQIVLARAALVAIAGDRDADAGVGLQELGLARQDLLRLRRDVAAVEGEEHPVADLLQLLAHGIDVTRRSGRSAGLRTTCIGGLGRRLLARGNEKNGGNDPQSLELHLCSPSLSFAPGLIVVGSATDGADASTGGPTRNCHCPSTLWLAWPANRAGL